MEDFSMKRYIPILFLLLFFLTACNDTPTETRTTVFAGQVLSCNFGSAFPDADVADPPHLTVHENLISVRVVSADGSVTKSAAYSLSGERNDASVIGGVHDPKAVAKERVSPMYSHSVTTADGTFSMRSAIPRRNRLHRRY